MATKANSLVSKNGPSGFGSLGIEANVDDYHARDDSSSSLVSSRTHAQLEEEDPMDESTEVEGECG
jgi:hypothetical protein